MRILTVVVVLIAGLVVVRPATAAPAQNAVSQAHWIEDASARAPVGADEVSTHLTPALLAGLGGVDGFNALLARTGPLTFTGLRPQPRRENEQVFGLADGWHLVLIAQPDGLVAYLALTPVPKTWAEVDAQLAALAPRASLVAAEIGGPAHAVDGDRAGPMASGFKTYVLGALAHAVATKKATWDEKLAIRADWVADNATPFGQLPVGTEKTLREYADAMMFYSDNTATEHLIRRLGRAAVELQQVRQGHRNPAANVPFLTPREMFVLKADSYPQYADRYEGLNRRDRRRFLDTEIAAQPTPTPTTLWSEPRNIDTIQWLGTAADLYRSFAYLWREQAGGPMALQGTTQVGLNATEWPVGWSKGGSEPGVLTRSHLAGTPDGRVFVVTLMLSDPSANSVNDSATAAAVLAVTAGAFGLLR